LKVIYVSVTHKRQHKVRAFFESDQNCGKTFQKNSKKRLGYWGGAFFQLFFDFLTFLNQKKIATLRLVK
jgi:hypothetical protein